MGDFFAHFHFLRPLWLLALLPAAFVLWAVGRHSDVRRRWRETIAPHLLDALVVQRRGRWRLRPVHLTAALIALGALALAGPTWQRERPPFLGREGAARHRHRPVAHHGRDRPEPDAAGARQAQGAIPAG
ncbi:MAG TPA: hypothetical protein VLJ19_22325 [Variovorax sp.]|nr:hypothetical protein [Variovorax sp.]